MGGHDTCLNRLLHHGLDINSTDHRGKNGLMYAAERGHLACLSVLVEQGGDIASMDDVSVFLFLIFFVY
jgi:ankyrin repeat protein